MTTETLTNKTASDLARELVGDGKCPNKYFITIGYGWYEPLPHDDEETPDMVQAPKSLKSVTIYLGEDKEAALEAYKSISPNWNIQKVTGTVIGQVILEDRLTGVVKEKFLKQTGEKSFKLLKS